MLDLDQKVRRDRKYRAFWAAFLSAVILVAFDKLNGDQFVELLTYVFGLYMVGNVGEHWTKAKVMNIDIEQESKGDK